MRTTALHPWHVGAGAVFEDVGQWKRPRYYPLPGEDMEAAVLRECAAVRAGVGILDGSTLGKIDVQGPDAGVLLDRIYTNMISNLAVGRARYGVMCGPDGMVIDDGTVLRLAEDRFMVVTTTGGAAKVLDWMEEWLQTEWPDLRVHLASVTEQWAMFPVVGPRSRDVVGAVFADLDVANDAFGFMAWRDTELDGVPVRVARISFSGELAYEVNVELLVRARRCGSGCSPPASAYGITPYGTETMHVLRAEKGYPIIGQDTDGTVTPQDLGWVGRCRRRSPTSSASAPSPGPRTPTRCASSSSGCCPPTRRPCCPRAPRSSDRPDGALPATTGADARARHLQLPQRRARPALRAGPAQGRPGARRRRGARPGRRRPRPRRGHLPRPLRPRRDPPRWLRR